jgi:hypothetical protein
VKLLHEMLGASYVAGGSSANKVESSGHSSPDVASTAGNLLCSLSLVLTQNVDFTMGTSSLCVAKGRYGLIRMPPQNASVSCLRG